MSQIKSQLMRMFKLGLLLGWIDCLLGCARSLDMRVSSHNISDCLWEFEFGRLPDLVVETFHFEDTKRLYVHLILHQINLLLTEEVNVLHFISKMILCNVFVDIEPLRIIIYQLELVDVLIQCFQEPVKVLSLPCLLLCAFLNVDIESISILFLFRNFFFWFHSLW